MALSDNMRERRAALRAQLDALMATVETRDEKNFTEEESAQFDKLVGEIRAHDQRIAELLETEAAEKRAAATRVETGEADGKEQRAGGAQVTDPPVYVKGGVNGNSFFRDMGKAALRNAGSTEAMDRLTRHNRMAADEKRALGNTNATGGSGGRVFAAA